MTSAFGTKNKYYKQHSFKDLHEVGYDYECLQRKGQERSESTKLNNTGVIDASKIGRDKSSRCVLRYFKGITKAKSKKVV
jgi:hypothetical protein